MHAAVGRGMWLPRHVATRVSRGTVAGPAAARVRVRSSSARNVFGPCVTCNARSRGPWHVATRGSRGEAAPRRAAHAGVGRGMRLQRGSRGGVQRTRCGAAAGGVRLARVRGCSMSLQGGSHGGREAITKVARPIARPETACARARSSSARNVCNTRVLVRDCVSALRPSPNAQKPSLTALGPLLVKELALSAPDLQL